MVESVTSATRSGLRDWLMQRITAIILAVYAIFILGYLVLHSPLRYEDWRALFNYESMRVFTFLAFFSVVYHTWIGIWTVLTDYIKCPYFRLILQILVIMALMVFLVWGVDIVWGF